jgi:acyl dehydratase
MAQTVFTSLGEVRAAVGQQLGVSDWLEISQDHLDRFAAAVRFPTPLLAGNRVRGAAELVACDEIPGGVQTTILITVEVDGADQPACVVESLSRWLA